MLRIPVVYILTAVIFAAMDAVWITLATPRLYQPEIGQILINGVRPAPAVLFYLIYLAGMVGLCVLPNLDRGRWLAAAGAGALLGLSAYAAYDLTNQATLKVWSVKVTIADLLWGSGATALASALSVALGAPLLKVLGLAARIPA